MVTTSPWDALARECPPDLYGRDAKLIEFDTADAGLVTAKSKRVILAESAAFVAKYLTEK